MNKARFENQIRLRKPGKAKKVDYGRQPSFAHIELYCEGCIGTFQAAKECPDQVCPLWLLRPGRPHTRDPGVVPTEAEYDAMMPEVSEEDRLKQSERMVKLQARSRAARAAKSARDDS